MTEHTQTPTREQIESAVGAVLFNVRNFPEAAQRHLLGRDMSPLRRKLTDAVSELLSDPSPSEERVPLEALRAARDAAATRERDAQARYYASDCTEGWQEYTAAISAHYAADAAYSTAIAKRHNLLTGHVVLHCSECGAPVDTPSNVRRGESMTVLCPEHE
ncbi:hypothetical protein [Curtobacterium sp. MCBD17_003]|uniref:hypothetical protein n=1 Tax=Curtobacterium sp. MCBD17_003 TaxID=2175667 RepID=UPI000DA9184A|nr:hypothetical protein [Curtobacterium sp. MCBD17_003]WIE54211.1 hypothetical protein DEI88_013965 [Curtobacterium sp. MCBD17_003]